MMTRYNSMLSCVLLLAMPGVAVAQHTGCRTADAATTRVLEYVKDYIREPTAATDSLGLTGVSVSSIVSETDSTTCVRVAQVVDSVFNATVAHPYVVVRAGPRFFAFAPSTDPLNPNTLLFVVDNAFVYRETIVAF
jgi:hypothetical protein